jgi:hypothetical protein
LNCFKERRTAPDHHRPMSQSIDLRGLDPPEPLLRVLAALDASEGPHVFLLPHEPWALYPMLIGTGWRHRARALDEACELTLYRDAPVP